MKFEQMRWNAITELMDDDIRERVHAEMAPCEDSDFLRRYLEFDPSFADTIRQEFKAELDAAKGWEQRIYINRDTAVSYTLEELIVAFKDADTDESFDDFLDRETAWDGSLAVI